MATRSATMRGEEEVAESGSRNLAFALFCVFIVSYFLHMAARIPVLGTVRFDVLLALAIIVSIFMVPKRGPPPAASPDADRTTRMLLVILGYIVVTLPFVEWPGTVLRQGLEPFAKAICFYFFVIGSVNSATKLKVFLAVFVACQLFRVLEPLYLHIVDGYWGSFASIGNWELMDRLSGAPSDTINPNGLAFVVLTITPLLGFLVPPNNAFRKLVWLAIAVTMLYVLVLTSSRSGFVALVFLAGFVIYRSKRRAALITALVGVAIVAFALMSDLQRERYRSLIWHDAKGAETAEGRVEGVKRDFMVALRRPLFGHGLGTSLEANANYGGIAQHSHDLYMEVAQELGFVGLFIFMLFIRAVIINCIRTQKATTSAEPSQRAAYLRSVASALLTLICVYIVFSLASYGLSEPYWYLAGGLSVAVARLAAAGALSDNTEVRPARNGKKRRVAARFRRHASS